MIVFFGSSLYSVPVLKALLDSGEKPLIVTTPSPNPLNQYAEKNQLTILKPDQLDQKSLKAIKKPPQLGICAVYGKLIPQLWLDFFAKGIINLHPSLLPQYRGASPATFAILKEEKQTGISWIKMDEQCDHGPIVKQIKQPLPPSITAGQLYQQLFQQAGKETVGLIKQYLKHQLKLMPQDEAKASFSRPLKRDDGKIKEAVLIAALKGKEARPEDLPPIVAETNPERKIFSPEIIDRLNRALSPWPGIYTIIKVKGKEKRLKILSTKTEKEKLILEEVQLEGKKPVTFSQFSLAYSWPA